MPNLPLDHAGRAFAQWNQVRPDLDIAPATVLARIRRMSSVIEPILDEVLDRYGLNHASFDTLSVLRRSGPPYEMTAGGIAEQCLRTPATLTARIARLERDGLVKREVDPHDRRASIIALTERGRELIDEVAPTYLKAEKLVLSALPDGDLASLAAALQRLLLSFEGFDTDIGGGRRVAVVRRLGVGLESLHRSAALRQSVGLPDRHGMLVALVDPGGAADVAGVREGDLIVEVDGLTPYSATILDTELAETAATVLTIARAHEDDMKLSVDLAPAAS